MASEVDICNRALQKLGAKRITSLTDGSNNAKACNASYETLRDALLRAHPWNFATKRTALAADSTAPSWGRATSFTLPADFLRLLPLYPEDNINDLDWQIEGNQIFTDESAPLYMRYTARISEVNLMDILFREALAALMAFELCEEITQSNTKKESLRLDLKNTLNEARRTNAIENVAAQLPEDEWLTVRN